MRRGKRVVDKIVEAIYVRPERQNEKPASERKVLHKIPKKISALTGAFQTKIGLFPELLPKQSGHDTIKSQEARYTVKDTRQDCE
jgi:hypothetical protein